MLKLIVVMFVVFCLQNILAVPEHTLEESLEERSNLKEGMDEIEKEISVICLEFFEELK